MSDDLVKRLRDHIAVSFDDRGHVFEDDALCDDAADEIAALQARVAELKQDKSFIIAERDKTFSLMLRRAEAAEALLSEAVKAGMLEGVRAADCGCLPDNSDCLAVKNSVPICYRDGAAEIHVLASDPKTIARIVAQVKEDIK